MGSDSSYSADENRNPKEKRQRVRLREGSNLTPKKRNEKNVRKENENKYNTPRKKSNSI